MDAFLIRYLDDSRGYGHVIGSNKTPGTESVPLSGPTRSMFFLPWGMSIEGFSYRGFTQAAQALQEHGFNTAETKP